MSVTHTFVNAKEHSYGSLSVVLFKHIESYYPSSYFHILPVLALSEI